MCFPGAKALVRALLEVNPNRRLTASQTLQQDWLQHAAAQEDHQGAAKPTHTTAETQRLVNTQLEIHKRDSHKPEMLEEKFHAAQIHENILNNNYEPDINAHDRNQIEEIQNMMSNQQYSSHAEDTTTNIENTTDQHVHQKAAQQEDTDSKQEYPAE